MRGLLSIVVLFVLAVVSSVAQAQVAAPGHVTLVKLDEDSAKKFAVIKIEGNILPPMAEELKQVFLQIPDGQRVIVDFDSPGGFNSEGYLIIDLITLAKEGRSLDTFVDNGALCASMCIPLFMQGQKRIAGARSVFMFHGSTPWYTNVPDVKATTEYTESLIRAGASEEWLQKLWDLGVFSEPMEYWLSGEDLFIEKSNIVTNLKDRLIKYPVREAPVDPNIKPR